MKTQISEKKANFPVKKKFWPVFSPIIGRRKPQGTFYKGPKERCFDNYCGSYKIFSVTPKKLLKTQFFEKKATFPKQKINYPLFLILSNMKIPTKLSIAVNKVLWQPSCKL